MQNSIPEYFIKFIYELASASGQIIRKYFRKTMEIDSKNDSTPVTVADIKAEAVMRQLIMERFPEHGILGEEFGVYNPYSEYRWILDPIDGTVSFICGAMSWGTLIGLVRNGKPVIGVFHQPILNELLIGDNYKTILNGNKVQMRKCSKLSEAVLLTTDHLILKMYNSERGLNNLIDSVKLYRNWGDCYGYYLLATGFADIMIDPVMAPWDILPLIPIIKGAGGIITGFNGDDAAQSNNAVAATSVIHEQVLSLLNYESIDTTINL